MRSSTWEELAAAILIPLTAFLLCLLASCTGCSSSTDKTAATPKTPELARTVQDNAQNTAEALVVAKTHADALTPENIPTEKPIVQTKIADAQSSNSKTLAGAGAVIKSSVADAGTITNQSDQISKLKDDAGQRHLLALAIVSLLVLGAVLTAVGQFASVPFLKPVGLALLAASGIVLIGSLIIQSITAIWWFFGIIVAVAFVLGLVKEIHDVLQRHEENHETWKDAVYNEFQDVKNLVTRNKSPTPAT